MTLQLKASAFEPGGDIPVEFTFALIVEDPDAPGRTWVHWVFYDLPATEREVQEGVPPQRTLPSGARQGRSDFGKIGYGGPCPPPGPAHR